MEGNHQESVAEAICLPGSRQANGISGVHDLAAINAQLVRENAQLARERDLLRSIIDNLPDPIYAKDISGRKTLANPADLKNLRCQTETEAIGKNDFDFFPRDVAEKFWVDDQKVIHGEPVINREEYFLDEDGCRHWLLTTKLPLREPGGSIIGLIGIGRNITEQKNAENLLAHERNLLGALIENMPDEIYFKDIESRFLNLNQPVARNLGVADPAKAIGKTDFDFFPTHQAREFRADEQELMQKGEALINKLEKRTSAGGRVTWTSSTKVPFRDKEGKVIGLVGVNRDVTQFKQMEELVDKERVLLRTIIDQIPDAIYVKDTQGQFILNNLVHARRRGVVSPAEMKGKSDFDYFPREEAEKFSADEHKIIETGESIINQEQYIPTNGATGDYRWVAVSKVLWQDQGKVLGTVGISRDIHESRLAREALRASEAKLREFTAQLERSNRELQDFAYVASHDLQEPLRKIVVFGERLKEKAASTLVPETLDYLERMQKAASRMQTLINDLLAFSRVTTKAQPFAQVDLAKTAREVIEDLEARIEMTKGRVELGQLPVIEAEPLQMRQLVQNLIGNALKFRRADVPPVVKIEAKVFSGILPDAPPDATPESLCELTVSDNGIGFDEKYLDRIFNVFQRLHTRNEYEGTGMGLAIARKIVVHHGGAITARSTPGQGATFIATLPVSHLKSNPQT